MSRHTTCTRRFKSACTPRSASTGSQAELEQALEELAALEQRAAATRRERRPRSTTPGWHLTRDLQNLIVAAEARDAQRAAPQESRGAHSRLDFPPWTPALAKVNMCVTKAADGMRVGPTPLPRDAGRAQGIVRTGEGAGAMSGDPGARSACSAATRRAVRRSNTTSRSRPAWWCSTRSTGSRQNKRSRPGRALELQGGQMRLVQRRGQRQARRSCARSRLDHFPAGQPIHVRPMKTFPIITRPGHRRVVELTRSTSAFPPFKPRADAARRWQQSDIDRAQEFRKCIECFLCQDVCHVLRAHELKHQFAGPRFLVRIAGLEMHPIDGEDRVAFCSRTPPASGCATSPSAAARSAPRASTSPTTPSSRSRSGWWTASTIR